DTSQPAVAVTTLLAESAPNANDGFYAQFTGIAAGNSNHETISNPFNNPAQGDGLASSWVPGELISEGTSLQNGWVSVSNDANGVSGDTINGPDALNFDLYSANPFGTTGALPTAHSNAMYMGLDGIGAAEEIIVVLKLWSDTDNDGVIEATDAFTTKAIIVENGDIYKFDNANWSATQTALAGSQYAQIAADIKAGNGSNNDGLIIIESNDYNGMGESWQIVGAQLINSAQGVSGTGINLNAAIGGSGGSSAAQAFSVIDNTSPLKITNIGFNVPTTTAQTADLTFTATIQDGDNDPISQTFHATVTDSADSSTAITLGASVTSVVPVVIDLNGDGVNFLGLSADVTYNYHGAMVGTAWAAADDGILAIDLNGDGRVSSSDEFVFGGDGMTELGGIAAKYDSNHDGILDANDTAFAQFGVWQDANSDGVSTPNEFTSLTDLGVEAIHLVSDGNSYTAADGDVTVAGTATVVWADGSTTTAADAAFAIDALLSATSGPEASQADQGLTDASGLPALQDAFSDAQAAGFVDALIDGVIGAAHDAAVPNGGSATLAGLLDVTVDIGGPVTAAPDAFEFAHAGLEAAAAATAHG
ncbi:MAG: hypothetical protein WCY11_20915, partial [Novosphingobium sp.]